VLYDAAGDRYLVSNINGAPDAADGNGYISELSPTARSRTPKLIAVAKRREARRPQQSLGRP